MKVYGWRFSLRMENHRLSVDVPAPVSWHRRVSPFVNPTVNLVVFFQKIIDLSLFSLLPVASNLSQSPGALRSTAKPWRPLHLLPMRLRGGNQTCVPVVENRGWVMVIQYGPIWINKSIEIQLHINIYHLGVYIIIYNIYIYMHIYISSEVGHSHYRETCANCAD